MAVRNDFAAGEVLAAADLNDTFASKVDYALPVNAQTGTTYTFVLADAEKLTTASNASPVTLTIPPQSSVTWADNTILRVVNYGAGAVTVNGGSGVTVTNTAATLAQFQSAAAIRTGSDAWTLVPFAGGVGNADFSNAATGTYTDTGVDYKYITYNASGTITFTKAGLATFLVVGGGGGGYTAFGSGGGGGVYQIQMPVEATTYSVAIGAGGAINTNRGMGGQSYVGANFNAAIARVSGGPSNWSNLEGAPSGNGYTTVAVASGAGAGGNATTNNPGGPGLASTITGSSVTYGAGGAVTTPVTKTANTGDGGDASGGAASAGASGVVIVRVRTN